MSQMVTRKSAVGDEKSSRQTDSPVKDMKKKVAANTEKEKQTADKPDKKEKPADKAPEKKDKTAEKVTDKKDKSADKATERKEKATDKLPEKKDAGKPTEKVAEKKDKPTDKVTEKKDKSSEKTEKVNEKKDDADKVKEQDKGEKSGKPDKPETPKAHETPKQNGQPLNGSAANGQELNGSVSSDEEDLLVIEEQDEVFPELTYDDDDEGFEPPTPENLSRSYTRRSQVKATRTPETPRPSDKQTSDPTSDNVSSEGSPSMLASNSDVERMVSEEGGQPVVHLVSIEVQAETHNPPPSEAKENKEKDSKVLKLKEDPPTERKLRSSDVKEKETDKEGDADIIVLDDEDGDRRKPDTNYSKSRVKVSPYRRSVRLDQTNTSLQANYTGNNTTMEMDITESSITDPPLDDSTYLSGLKSIRGRRSYKPLKEMNIRRIANSSASSNVTLSEQGRPTVTVVGRKRRPDDAGSTTSAPGSLTCKRPRLIDRIAMPFRRQNAEIVGINTDLPLSSPAPASGFDPESLKNMPAASTVLTAPTTNQDRRCIVM